MNHLCSANRPKSEFLLDPEVVYLNHGSWGACSRSVFEVYQHWQRDLEWQPMRFMQRRANDLLTEARATLAAYLNAGVDEVVYFTNATIAINMVARSLSLQPGDEILTTNQEYGAMNNTWRFVCHKTGAQYIQHPIPLPVTNHADFVESLWEGVTKRTRVIFFSHVTSPTALTFPVEELCRRAREAGLLSVVDGAHAVSQIPLDLTAIGADIYIGTCHKWLCSPKGSAFLYARREAQSWLEPLVVSSGWERNSTDNSEFVTYHQWQGTRDLSAFLSVPAAIEFQAQRDWEEVRRRCHLLASETRARVNAFTGLEPICPDSPEWFSQMATILLPDVDPALLGQRIRDEYHIEVPIGRWNDHPGVRVSFQAYNDQTDADMLVDALAELLPQMQVEAAS